MASKIAKLTFAVSLLEGSIPFKTQTQAREFAEDLRKMTAKLWLKHSDVSKENELKELPSIDLQIVAELPANEDGSPGDQFELEDMIGPIKKRATLTTTLTTMVTEPVPDVSNPDSPAVEPDPVQEPVQTPVNTRPNATSRQNGTGSRDKNQKK